MSSLFRIVGHFDGIPDRRYEEKRILNERRKLQTRKTTDNQIKAKLLNMSSVKMWKRQLYCKNQ